MISLTLPCKDCGQQPGVVDYLMDGGPYVYCCPCWSTTEGSRKEAREQWNERQQPKPGVGK